VTKKGEDMVKVGFSLFIATKTTKTEKERDLEHKNRAFVWVVT